MELNSGLSDPKINLLTTLLQIATIYQFQRTVFAEMFIPNLLWSPFKKELSW